MGNGSMIYSGIYDSHILTIASAGSGKGVGVVIPNLLKYEGSVVVLDPKGENFFVTAEHRSNVLSNKIFYFDPWGVVEICAKVHRKGIYPGAVKATINPLDLVDAQCTGVEEIAHQIAQNIVMSDVSGDNKIFYTGAQSLLKQLIVFVCCAYAPGSDKRNLIEVRRLLTIPMPKLFNEILRYQNNNPNIHNSIYELLNWIQSNYSKTSGTSSKHAQSVYNIAITASEFISTSDIQKAIKETNIEITKIKEQLMTLYLILDTDKLIFSSSLYQPFFQIIVWFCMKGVGVKAIVPKEKILFLLDEIAQLGTLSYMENLLSLYRGYHVVVWTIWQSLAQIKALYGEERASSILNNCNIQQFFGINSLEDAKYVSELFGKTTIWLESFTKGQTESETIGDTTTTGTSFGKSDSVSDGDNQSYSYQGLNLTYTSGSSATNSKSSSYTDSYNFSRSIQHGVSKTENRQISKKEVDLIASADVIKGAIMEVVFLSFTKQGGCPYPILSGKIKYWDDLEFYDEYGDNLTRIKRK